MLKEIFEQPEAVARTASLWPQFDEILAGLHSTEGIQRVLMAASGTSRHAGIAAKTMIEALAGLPVEVDFASEVQHRPLPSAQDTLVVVITQSGETADTIGALRRVKETGAKVLAISNVQDASVMQAADAGIHTKAGPELAVPSTKAFTAQLTAVFLLALWLGKKRNAVNSALVGDLMRQLELLPTKIEQVLSLNNQVHSIAKEYLRCSDFFFTGRGVHYAAALDGALKLKEVSYRHAEALPTGEIAHGPLALVDDRVTVVSIATQDKADPESVVRYQKTLTSLEQVKQRSGKIISIGNEGGTELAPLSNHLLQVPSAHELLMAILEIIPLQLFAYHIATLEGLDVDRPRGLSKAVLTG